MHPSDFCELAGFPDRWQEKDLQMYIVERLRARGCGVEYEVKANGGRADIVSDWQGGCIIEVKKYLDRNNIYQASGQLGLYGLNNKRKLIMMGFFPPDANEHQSAVTTASMVEQDARISVIFVNLEEEWLPNASVGGFKMPSLLPKFSLPKLPRFDDWRWWLEFFKKHPIAIGILILLCWGAIGTPAINTESSCFLNCERNKEIYEN